jgi:hypothetical protein
VNNNEVADYLENYNLWRRDNNTPSIYNQPNATELGRVIDKAVNVLRGNDKIETVKVTIPASDAINPAHYQTGGIESIDYMKAKATPEEFNGFLRLTALKYLSRYGYKDDVLQEVKKAKWYIERLIKELENE